MNNPLAETDPSGYAPEVETEDIVEKIAVTGSRIKRNIVVRQTATLMTQDANGNVDMFIKQIYSKQ